MVRKRNFSLHALHRSASREEKKVVNAAESRNHSQPPNRHGTLYLGGSTTPPGEEEPPRSTPTRRTLCRPRSHPTHIRPSLHSPLLSLFPFGFSFPRSTSTQSSPWPMAPLSLPRSRPREPGFLCFSGEAVSTSGILKSCLICKPFLSRLFLRTLLPITGEMLIDGKMISSRARFKPS